MNSISERDDMQFKEIKCIWMSSNIIEYKLCDRNFECDNCIFDKVMRNLSNELQNELNEKSKLGRMNLLDRLINIIAMQEANGKTIYLKNQLRVKYLFGDNYYLGFNPVFMSLLDNITSIKNFEDKNIYKMNERFFTLSGDWGSINLQAPMNLILTDKIHFSPGEIAKHNWFAIISAKDKDISAASISVNDLQKEQLDVISFLNNYRNQFQGVGETLYDGGKEVQFIYQAVGKKNYKNLIARLLKI
jgi:hypothetical protein